MQFSPSVILSLNIGTQAAQAGWDYPFTYLAKIVPCFLAYGLEQKASLWESQVCASGPMSNYLLRKEIERKQLEIIAE